MHTLVFPSDRPTACYALVPCAGSGSRAGTLQPKQYIHLAGLPLVAHTLRALAAVPQLRATLVVLAPGDEQFEREVPSCADQRLWLAWVGAASRAESVANGLEALLARGAQPHDWVLVHDAARCLLRPEWVTRLLQACQGHAVGGLLALPLADTLKCASPQDEVSATLDRQGKWAAQTPQMFRLGALHQALRAALADPVAAAHITDEASALEHQGAMPLLVRGELENFKVTWPGDFALAERLLRTAPGAAA